jgi:CrcB protein
MMKFAVSGGVYFEVLPANMLGTFIIGLVGTSAMVKLDETKAIAVLGPEHPWQRNGPLQVGVRTGLCGSITTFSSWMLEAMQTCLTGNQWLTGIGQILVGLACVFMSYAFGIQCALLIHHAIWKEAAMEDEMISFQRESAEFVFRRTEERPGRLSEGLEAIEVDLPRQEPLGKDEIRSGDFSGNLQEEAAKKVDLARTWLERHEAFKTRTARVAVICLVLLTVGSCFGVAYETKHVWIREIWLAVLFAPLGCVARWLLAKLNYSLGDERIKWLPIGTLFANYAGAIADYVLAAVVIKVSPSYWGSLVIGAVENGFCGCLTTVSTLIAELMTLADLLPFSLRAYTYGLLTFVGSFVWGLVFLGWVFWTS